MADQTEIPLRDTPALSLIERGFGGEDTDATAVADCMQLLRVSKHLLAHFFERFADEGISPGKYSVLLELLTADAPVSPSFLADRIGVRRPTITGLLDGLCHQGYVARRIDDQDRRRVSVELTRDGRRFVRDLLPRQFGLMADVLGDLDAAERRQLRRILTKVEGRVT